MTKTGPSQQDNMQIFLSFFLVARASYWQPGLNLPCVTAEPLLKMIMF